MEQALPKRRFSGLKINQKILLGYALVLVIVIINPVMYMSIAERRDDAERDRRVARERVETLADIRSQMGGLSNEQLTYLLALFGETPELAGEALGEASMTATDVQSSINDLSDRTREPAVKAELAILNNSVGQYLQDLLALDQAVKESAGGGGITLIDTALVLRQNAQSLREQLDPIAYPEVFARAVDLEVNTVLTTLQPTPGNMTTYRTALDAFRQTLTRSDYPPHKAAVLLEVADYLDGEILELFDVTTASTLTVFAMNDQLAGINRQIDALITSEIERLEASASRVEALEDRSGRLMAITTVGILLAIIGALYLVNRTVTRPISNLARTTQQVTAGNYATQIPVRSGDEVGELALRFKGMVRAVEEREDRLRDQALELAEARDRAEESNRLKTEFVATVSHELRTPLTAITNFTNLFQMGLYGEMNEKQTHAIERVYVNARHLHVLITDLLDFSRLERGKLRLAHTRFPVQALVSQIKDRLEPKAELREIDFQVKLAPDFPNDLVGDADRIAQVVQNLADNAIKFTEEGHVYVRFRLEDDRQHYAILVEDTGIGIPAANQRDIFETFRQVDGSVTRQHGGVGLGLAIVHKLVTAMNGKVAVNSVVGAGSTFVVTLPLLDGATSPEAPSPEETPAG
jgi:signal transduction histidine kinase